VSWVSPEATRRNVKVAIDTDGSVVLGHAIDLERLLRNLIDNAVRHSPDDEPVRIMQYLLAENRSGDVDRFGALGRFHWWQPYAQLGVQSTTGSFRPVLTGNLFPVNLGFDVNDALSINIGGGLALIYDPQTGMVQAGMQGTAGLVFKFDGSPGSR